MSIELIEQAAAVTPPAFGEIWAGQGGFYGGTMPALPGFPAHHLVFSEHEAEGLMFGPYDLDVSGAGSRIDGRANTEALLASGKEHPAANWAKAYRADGHKDFHLPSQADLFMALLCAPNRFNKRGWYWSSTQGSRSLAFAQHFEDGLSHWYYKGDGFRVRAVRAIPL